MQKYSYKLIKIKLQWPCGSHMLLSLATGFSQAIAVAALYLHVSASWGGGLMTAVIFTAVFFLGGGLGAWWTGQAIDGESSIAPRTLAMFIALTGFTAEAFVWLSSTFLRLEFLVYPWVAPVYGLQFWLARLVALLPLVIPAFFLGGCWSLLGEITLKKTWLGLSVPLISGLWLIGAALAVGAIYLWLPENWLLPGSLAAAILIAAILLIGNRKNDTAKWWRLWPSSSLGLWADNAMDVLDKNRASKLTRPIRKVAFLGSVAGAGSLFLWSGYFGLIGLSSSADGLVLWFMVVLAALAFGILALAPLLSKVSSSLIAMGLAMMFMAVGLICGPGLIMERLPLAAGVNLFENPALWLLIWPTAALGALWPLSVQAVQLRRQWLGSSLGLAAFWLCVGAGLGVLLAAVLPLSFRQAAILFSCLAILASALAFSQLLSRPLALAAGGALGLVVFFILHKPVGMPPDFFFPAKSDSASSAAPRLTKVIERPGLVIGWRDDSTGYSGLFFNGQEIWNWPTMGQQGFSLAAIAADGLLEKSRPGLKDSIPVLVNASQNYPAAVTFYKVGRQVTVVGPAAVNWPLTFQKSSSKRFLRFVPDDLRHFLSLTAAEYALIFSGPLDSSLSSKNQRGQKFYNLARQRLIAGGIMMQSVNLKELTSVELKAEVDAFAKVFGQASLWKIKKADLLIIVNTAATDLGFSKSGLERWADVLKESELTLDDLETVHLSSIDDLSS